MEAITSRSYKMNDLDLLQNKLKKELTGKTFLIVLDDVWIEPLDEKWNILLKPFRDGNKGGKILLTTRNEKVSLVMPTVQTYELRSLSDEDCWLVFLQHSFLSTECGEYDALQPIGREIVAKCKGLPLVAKTLGSLLRSKYDKRDWNDVLKSEIWEFPEDESKIIPALKVSYHYLPSHLKRCFVYCSLFPQDHEFDKDELILLWMAEDFLQPMGEKTLEEIGNGCVELKMLPSGMQDLVNLRHLDIEGTCLEEMPKAMSKLKHLQFLSNYIVGKDEENKIRELGPLAALHRSLDISNLENVVNSDEASGARIIDKEYINSLVLRWLSNSSVADSQMEREILDKLHPHSNLKELSIDGYRGTILSDWLGHSSYKNMTNLTLERCKNCCMLPSLGQLPSLKHLEISNFDNLQSIGAEFYVSDDESCSETPFRSLETLKFDGLCCWKEWHSLDDAFPQLKVLTIKGCPMLIGDLPNRLPALEELTIDWRCEQLACSLPRSLAMLQLTIPSSLNKPRMEELPLSLPSLSIRGNQLLLESMLEAMTNNQPTCLRELDISNCDSAVSFPGDCLPSSLQELRIQCCKKLDFPMQQQQQHDSLRELTIYQSCDSLTSFPLNAFPNLTDLYIEECENMKSLAVVSQSHDTAISSLRSLSIMRCPKFASFSTLRVTAPQLSSLTIWNCPEIDSFPEGGLPPNLKLLEIMGCDKLLSCLGSMDLRSHGLTGLSIDIKSESVKSFPKESWLSTSLESLYLWHCPSVETLDCNGLSHLTSLQSLAITYCDKLENMTGERLPAFLKDLHIYGSPLLAERCRVKNPQIWPKISHIPCIEVNLEQIS